MFVTDRARERYIRLSVGPDTSNLTDCTPYPDLDTEGHKNITVHCDRVGRIVHYRVDRSEDLGLFSVCEVVVTASWIGELYLNNVQLKKVLPLYYLKVCGMVGA